MLPRSQHRAVLQVAVIALACAGCGGAHEHVRAGTEVAAREGAPVRRTGQIRPIAPPCRDVEVVLAAVAPEVAPGDARALAGALASALLESGEVRTASVSPAGGRKGAAVRVEIAPTRFDLDERENEHFAGAVVAYLCLGIWSDWWHERRASLDCAYAVTLRDARTGRALGRVPLARGAAAEDLSFWERRGGFWPALATAAWVPPMAFDSTRAKLVSLLLPEAARASAGAVLDALAVVKAREVQSVAIRPLGCDGVALSIVEPPPATATAAAPATVTARIAGPRVREVRRAWLGEDLAYETAPGEAPAGPHEIALPLDVQRLARRGALTLLVQIGDRPPVPVAEVGVVRSWRLDAP